MAGTGANRTVGGMEAFCDKVLRHLTEIAESGAPCPSNADIAKSIRVATSTASDAIRRLRETGAIISTSHPGGRARVITIASTGAATAPATNAIRQQPQIVSRACGDAKFLDMLKACGERFEDSPRACRPVPRLRMMPAPTPLSRDAACGIAGSFRTSSART